jgi:hypothetical protein
MKVATTNFRQVFYGSRFDAKFFLDSGDSAAKRVSSGIWPLCTVADIFGKENIWMPGRFARVWASDPSYGKPLLVPYDNFRYMPWSCSYLSKSQVVGYSDAEVSRGMILIVRSGRNCGPVTMVDRFLEQFTISDDMIRISGGPSDELFYFYSFLSTPTGQALVRRDRNGSVIDHLGPDQIGALQYPVVKSELKASCAAKFREGFERREQARLLLAGTQREFLRHFNLIESETDFEIGDKARRFTVTRSRLFDRIDAEPNVPLYAAWRARIRASGGCALGEIAEVFKPYGRYRTNYVEDSRFGIRMMNGRQISQYRPIGLKLMSFSAFKNPASFQLVSGTTLLTADGRAEENLADCALVTRDREGWAASGHVHRVSPRPGIHPGLVYLACSCAPVQAQLKALATGSVVDALNEADVSSVTVPYSDSASARQLGEAAVKAWGLFAEASASEEEAIAALEVEFAGGN